LITITPNAQLIFEIEVLQIGWSEDIAEWARPPSVRFWQICEDV